MSYVVMGLGLLIIVAALLILVRPGLMIALVPSLVRGKNLYLVASARLLAGCAMILAAPQAHHPLVIEIVGWLAVTAGLLMIVLPPKAMQAIVSWSQGIPPMMMRAASPPVLFVGSYLVWSFV